MPYKPRGQFKFYVVNTSRHTFARPRSPYMEGNGLCNKDPHEYKDSHEYGRNKNGIKWYFRLKKRGNQREWPFTQWTEDPFGHLTQPPPRCFSAKEQQRLDTRKIPRWNVYALDQLEFKINPDRAPFVHLMPILRTYVGSVFSSETITDYLKQFQAVFPTLHALLAYENVPLDAKHIDERLYQAKIPRNSTGRHPCQDINIGSKSREALGLSALGNGPGSDHITGYHRVLADKVYKRLNTPSDEALDIPRVFILHVVMLCDAIVEQHVATRYRQHLHKNHAILRTNDGERYYALPYMQTGPAWPTKTAQAGDAPTQYADAVGVPNVPTKDYAKFYDAKVAAKVQTPEFKEDSEALRDSSLANVHPILKRSVV